jgi:hypothetical protein
MSKLVYRDILGNNPRKREVSIEEIDVVKTPLGEAVAKGRVSKKRICKYFVEEKFTAEDLETLKKWVRMKKKNRNRNDCHVLRHIDTRTGYNKIICKVLGELYVIKRPTVYKIVYMNELRIQIDGVRGRERKR